ncbi:MAG: 30S ribosomal protein S16 [Candidatus Levybacteria bacterium RIFCSPHIGHO2_02_FULL_42_12]|nr:MAG: 30S ribosomal protein S16 [Candidatus Levybacteria bacterium RIFCSPHIGHO2_01_FULL_42_15]OGH30868.1 MAG: 30S ribosomal protein S16 [Candidatus Levybacteria bacterium RIFCSPHIGHO2_02_FULL_42_12]OGH42108.1 MAG: 30S ribosomal protein S16 [Candidatus Levybacteria bacterium RIFCSPLOWO2_01_FULL_42_15]
MSVVIRLTKVGKKGEAKFRVVVKEKRSRRDGKAIETLGWFQKFEKGSKQEINRDRVVFWISKGARPSPTIKKILES